ncbi:MAG: tryptophan synthase subunit alpha [Bacteroidota bacterium]
MNRITERLESLRQQNKKALSLFITAGYPNIETSINTVIECANAGADLIELGIPFSDPIADGPVIQHCSEVSLRNGTTMEQVFHICGEVRSKTSIPLILMGYSNPILAYGMERFFDKCASLGVDGSIIPDIPLEESEEYRKMASAKNISTIFLAAPTTSNERLAKLDIASNGFLYCITVTGITGERPGVAGSALDFLIRAKKSVKKNPLLAGFGISTVEDAMLIAKAADGIVIGSALMKILGNSNGSDPITNIVNFVTTIRSALDNVSSILIS